MTQEWYYTKDGKNKMGPLSAPELKALAASGALTPTDMVWKEGMAQWIAASKVKGLFATSEPTGPINESNSPAANPTSASAFIPSQLEKSAPSEPRWIFWNGAAEPERRRTLDQQAAIVEAFSPPPGTDAAGITALIFGFLAFISLLAGCFIPIVFYPFAIFLALVGLVVSFWGKGRLKIAGLTSNGLTPSVLLFLGCAFVLARFWGPGPQGPNQPSKKPEVVVIGPSIPSDPKDSVDKGPVITPPIDQPGKKQSFAIQWHVPDKRGQRMLWIISSSDGLGKSKVELEALVTNNRVEGGKATSLDIQIKTFVRHLDGQEVDSLPAGHQFVSNKEDLFNDRPIPGKNAEKLVRAERALGLLLWEIWQWDTLAFEQSFGRKVQEPVGGEWPINSEAFKRQLDQKLKGGGSKAVKQLKQPRPEYTVLAGTCRLESAPLIDNVQRVVLEAAVTFTMALVQPDNIKRNDRVKCYYQVTYPADYSTPPIRFVLKQDSNVELKQGKESTNLHSVASTMIDIKYLDMADPERPLPLLDVMAKLPRDRWPIDNGDSFKLAQAKDWLNKNVVGKRASWHVPSPEFRFDLEKSGTYSARLFGKVPKTKLFGVEWETSLQAVDHPDFKDEGFRGSHYSFNVKGLDEGQAARLREMQGASLVEVIFTVKSVNFTQQGFGSNRILTVDTVETAIGGVKDKANKGTMQMKPTMPAKKKKGGA